MLTLNFDINFFEIKVHINGFKTACFNNFSGNYPASQNMSIGIDFDENVEYNK